MALELRQQLKLTQQLVMTPQLQQAIKLLQLSRIELLETVKQELMENPFLEEGEPEGDARNGDGTEIADEQREGATDPTTDQDAEALIQSTDWQDYLGEFSSLGRQALVTEWESPEEGPGFETRFSEKPSLAAHLTWQLAFAGLSEREMGIGEYLIGNLEPNGYLHVQTDDVCSALGVDPIEVEKVIHALQRFDPVGVAARSVRECLLVQLEAIGADGVMTKLVSEHLDDVENRRYPALARKLGVDLETLKHYIDILHSLEPMPGASFGGDTASYISPDVYVYRLEDEFVIVLNEDGLPKLQLNPLYMEEMKHTRQQEREFFQDKLKSAQWLMKSLYQRQRTLFKVTESIVRRQHAFFERGVSALRPLVLRDVAEDIAMHESTVSRVTTNKYMATPHGIFDFKFFFNSSLSMEDGGEMGSESVKAALKEIVARENPKRPMSDEKIVSLLQEKLGVEIARRTVAKYRKALGIPSSSKRKQFF